MIQRLAILAKISVFLEHLSKFYIFRVFSNKTSQKKKLNFCLKLYGNMKFFQKIKVSFLHLNLQTDGMKYFSKCNRLKKKSICISFKNYNQPINVQNKKPLHMK
jgi:hypothetical protein